MATYVRRRYICKKCSHVYEGSQVVLKGGADPMEPCPQCNKGKVEIIERPRDPDLRAGPRAKAAVDYTYKMAEKDYGMTDMRDNLRAGDLAMKVNNPVTQAMEKQGGSIFGAQGANAAIGHHGSAMSMAAGARAERKAQGISDPVMGLQKAVKEHGRVNYVDNAGRGRRFQ